MWYESCTRWYECTTIISLISTNLLFYLSNGFMLPAHADMVQLSTQINTIIYNVTFWSSLDTPLDLLCVKSVQIQSFFWSEYRKTRTRKTTYLRTFHAVFPKYFPWNTDAKSPLSVIWVLSIKTYVRCEHFPLKIFN